MIEPPFDKARQAQGLMPPTFPPEYVEGAIKPFLVSTMAMGDQPALPMIELAYSKNAAIPPHLVGMLYDNWTPEMEEEGLSVFLQAYEDRGRDNARKKIYMSATTPDLWDRFYSAKVERLLDAIFDPANAGQPVMRKYYDHYFDMYWDLHLGVRGDAVPDYVRTFGASFTTVLGFWFPTLEIVQRNYMTARETREPLRQWVDARVQDVLDHRIEGWEGTFVHYWAKNGALGEDFRRKDIVFECYHNLLAFSQWGNTFYNIMLRLSEDRGDPAIRDAFERTMRDPEAKNGSPFTALDRFTMELMRVISPNGGSFSSLNMRQGFLGQGYSGILHTHPEASQDPRHWQDPEAFNPDRYLHAPTSLDNDAGQARRAGLARCPFHAAPKPVSDGRDVEVTNSAYGASYAVVDGVAHPVCDTAGYAPFGFGYRRCAGEYLTIGAIGSLLRRLAADGLVLRKVEGEAPPEKLPVGPTTIIDDDLTFFPAGASR